MWWLRVKLVSETLNISWKLHILYCPQSSGKAERADKLIEQLTKVSVELRLSWPTLLSIALSCLHTTLGSPTGLYSFEFLYGRSFLFNHCLWAQTPLLLGYLPYFSPI